MFLRSLLLTTILAVSQAVAQTSSSIYVESNVPTGTPVPGNYAGVLRPQVHFSPPQGFMNDPNSMFIDANGTYHLYYQYNPTATVAGDQHQGHATSTDGYHWLNQQIALFPPNNHTFVYTGSAVVDVNNTSGFFPGQDNGVVAIFTLADVNPGGVQDQNIAYSRDGGFTFEMFSGNPVINVNSNQFRDPKVLWYPDTSSWVMAVSYAADFTIGIYTSPNLQNWTHASNFSHHGLLGLQYECPNLVQVPVRGSSTPGWIMWISINPGAPLGGSISQYFSGSFNGTHFTTSDDVARIADFGKDSYAGQFFYQIPNDAPIGDALSIDWCSNWQYTDLTPTGPIEGWRSSMSVPRSNYLDSLPGVGAVLVSAPHNIQSIFSQELAYNTSLNNGTILLDYSSVASRALYFEVNVTSLSPYTLQGTANFTFTSSLSGESVRGGTTVNGDTWLSRQHTYGFDNPYFTDKFSATGVYSGAANGTWTISGVLDRTILEVFVNGGQQSGTMTFFPEQPLDVLMISAGGVAANASVSVAVWGLESGWAMQEDVNGTVSGNVSTKG